MPDEIQPTEQHADGVAPGAPMAPAPPAAPAAPPRRLLSDPPELGIQLDPILRQIRQLRGRPLFVLISSGIDEDTCQKVFAWRTELRRIGGGNNIDVLIHSPGGVLSDCYTISRALSRHTDAWHALVPSLAASGATLICLGSETLIMCPVAQLGPLDPQVISKRREKFFQGERQSPLEALRAVRFLRESSLAALDTMMMYLLKQGVTPQHALETGSQIAVELAQPVLSKIDPYDLGAFSLDMDVSMEYCSRIATPADLSKRTQRTVDYRALVDRYPAHEFVIDLEEAVTLGFNAVPADQPLEDLFHAIRGVVMPQREYECVGLLSPGEVQP